MLLNLSEKEILAVRKITGIPGDYLKGNQLYESQLTIEFMKFYLDIIPTLLEEFNLAKSLCFGDLWGKNKICS